ncbi:hypothetical protein [Microbacterium sp. 1.5R]|uniref:hypothetical protein n=1 Tax=Microbacterium sp. 1.5R TaxID=1916917 RepID=UPI0011A5B22F|nr:hypothetical protein [Microbacterium sp. 1.5R]
MARERAGKEALARSLVEHSAALAPGTWRLLDTRTAALTTEGLLVSALRRLDPRRGIKRSVLDVRRLVVPPRVTTIAPTVDDLADDRPVRILLTKDGGLVGFDRRHTTVTHLRRSPLPAEYRERRVALDDVYRSVRWRLSDDGLTLVEQHVAGSPASAWSAAARIELLRRMLRATAERLPEVEHRRSFVDAPDRLAAMTSAARWHEVRDADATLGPVPWVISHGDLTPENAIGEGPDAWAPIDFEDAREAPFFFDALSLAVRDAELRAALLSGRLGEEWELLAAAAEVDGRVLTPRVALDAVALMAADHHHRMHGGDFDYTLRSLTE